VRDFCDILRPRPALDAARALCFFDAAAAPVHCSSDAPRSARAPWTPVNPLHRRSSDHQTALCCTIRTTSPRHRRTPATLPRIHNHHSNRSTSPSRKIRTRRPDATHSDPQPHNTLDTVARAYLAETRRPQLKSSGRMAGHIQVWTTFWFLTPTLDQCTLWAATSVLLVLAALLETHAGSFSRHMLTVLEYSCSFANECWSLIRVRRRTGFAVAEPQLEHVLDAGGTFRVALRLVVGSLAETEVSSLRLQTATGMTRRLQMLQHVRYDEALHFFAVHRCSANWHSLGACCSLRKKIVACAKAFLPLQRRLGIAAGSLASVGPRAHCGGWRVILRCCSPHMWLASRAG
jgi:hypothetical protein